jgi:hypothetical protein
MGKYKVSSALLVGLLVFSTLAVGSVGVATAKGSSSEIAANAPLEDGEFYFQGQILYNDTFAKAGEELELRNETSNKLVRNVTADDSGAIVINSTDLDGDYYLQNESDQTVVAFEVVEHHIHLGHENYYYVDDGTHSHFVNISMTSNLLSDYEIALESPTVNLTERVEGAREVNGTAVVSSDAFPVRVNVGGLENDTYRIDADAMVTTASANVTFKPSNDTHVEFERQVPTTEIVENGWYWGSHTLAYDHGIDENLILYVERSDGDVYTDEIEMNETGWHVLSGQYETNSYYLENETGKVVNFSTTAQTVDASFAQATVEADTNETNLSLSSNRDGYDALFWAENASRETLNESIPASTVTGEGDIVVRDLSSDESLTFNYSALPAGNYTMYVSSNDTTAQGSATVQVEERSSDDDEEDDGGGGGGGGGDVDPPSVRVEVVDKSEGHLLAKVTSARADSSASVTLSGLGTDAATFQRLEVTPESSDPLPRFLLDASVEQPLNAELPDESELLAALRVEPTYVSNDELDAVVVRFRTATDSTDPEAVTLYRSVDGEWTSLDTEFVGERDGDYAFRATATGVSLFAVGVDDSAVFDDDSESATETQTTSETTSATSESAMESGNAETDTATPSSGPVGHGASSVLVPLVAVLLTIGLKVRNH